MGGVGHGGQTLTLAAVAELCARAPDPVGARRTAEAAAMLRLAGQLDTATVGRGRWAGVVAAGPVPARLRGLVTVLSGHTCAVRFDPGPHPGDPAPGTDPGARLVALEVAGAVAIVARRLGLLDHRGRPLRGLPPRSWATPIRPSPPQCGGGRSWRPGSSPRRTGPQRSAWPAPGWRSRSRWPGRPAGSGVAARCHPGTGHTHNDVELVAVTGELAVLSLLCRIGAPARATRWQQARRARPAPPPGSVVPAGFATSNTHRSSAAAAAITARAAAPCSSSARVSQHIWPTPLGCAWRTRGCRWTSWAPAPTRR